MKDYKERTLGEIVTDNIHAKQIFEVNKIDYYNNGQQTLREACQGKIITVEDIIQGIGRIKIDIIDRDDKMNKLSITELCDYIVERFHRKQNEMMDAISVMFVRVVEKYQATYPELIGARNIFELTKAGINFHQVKEEITFFPFFRNMEKVKSNHGTINEQNKSIVDSVKVLKNEQKLQAGAFTKIRQMLNDYVLPDDADNLFKATAGMLQDLEEDLHLHLHAENNILFSNALELFQEICQ